jgi:diketogulonate reductase-like aldo/keto reductase
VVGPRPPARARLAGGRGLAVTARAHRATPRQVTLAFLTRNGVFAIPKSSSPEHVRENAGAGELRLGAEETRRLEESLPRPSGRGAPPTL